MSAVPWLALGVLLGYAIGAVPVGYVVCRLYGVNIREVGSGRTGTTNAWRAAGLKAALPTLLGDSVKGAAAIWLVQWLTRRYAGDLGAEGRILALALTGGMAVIGHNWSAFLGFRGGAGGITCAVACMALHPFAGLIVWMVGACMMYWGRIAALATFSVSITSLAVFLAMAVLGDGSWAYLAFPALSVIAIAIALRQNRAKLKMGEERVITLW